MMGAFDNNSTNNTDAVDSEDDASDEATERGEDDEQEDQENAVQMSILKRRKTGEPAAAPAHQPHLNCLPKWLLHRIIVSLSECHTHSLYQLLIPTGLSALSSLDQLMLYAHVVAPSYSSVCSFVALILLSTSSLFAAHALILISPSSTHRHRRSSTPASPTYRLSSASQRTSPPPLPRSC